MRSPAAWSARSSRACWPRKAFARFRVRPTISAPGSWWRARKPRSGGSTAKDYASRDRRAETRGRGLSGLRAGAKPARRSVWCLPRTRAGSIGTRACSAGRAHVVRAIALDDSDPWGQIALGYWSMMEWRTEELIAAFRRAVSLNPSSAAAHCYLSHGLAFAGQDCEAIAHGEEAIRLSPLDPDMRDVSRRHCRRALSAPADMRKPPICPSSCCVCGPGFHGAQRLRCASLAQNGQNRGGAEIPRRPYDSSSRSCRSTG